MALLVILVPATRNFAPLDSEAVEALARLGVTTLSLARDDETVAFILDGWAFDPSAHDGALAVLGAEDGSARPLQPVMHMAVSAAAKERGRR